MGSIYIGEGGVRGEERAARACEKARGYAAPRRLQRRSMVIATEPKSGSGRSAGGAGTQRYREQDTKASSPARGRGAGGGGGGSRKVRGGEPVKEGGEVTLSPKGARDPGRGNSGAPTLREALLSRRPDKRPLVITRSTFAGAGAKVGHWLGDNTATWDQYRISIAEMLEFAAIFQIPMVGSDVCGYAENTTATLCARWAMLGAWNPFYRNHNSIDTISQEFYRWPLVAAAARNAIKVRYMLLDYIYTAMHKQSVDGTPLLNPLWFLYPQDANTLPIDLQFFYGRDLLISPVTNENVTDVTFYLPNDQFYDFFTHLPIRGDGENMTLSNVDYTSIPVHIRGGSIIPMRVDGANTTTALRKLDFNVLVAPGMDGTAKGSLYLDDGESLVQKATSNIIFAYDGTTLTMSGTFGYDIGGVKVAKVTVLGIKAMPKSVMMDGKDVDTKQSMYDQKSMTLTVTLGASLSKGFKLTMSS